MLSAANLYAYKAMIYSLVYLIKYPFTFHLQRKAVIQSLYLGRNPPMFTDIRVVNQSTDDDHLVCNVNLIFLSLRYSFC
jgi:hypothetical protein